MPEESPKSAPSPWLAPVVAILAVIVAATNVWVNVRHNSNPNADSTTIVYTIVINVLCVAATTFAVVRNWIDARRAKSLQVVIDDLRVTTAAQIDCVKAQSAEREQECRSMMLRRVTSAEDRVKDLEKQISETTQEWETKYAAVDANSKSNAAAYQRASWRVEMEAVLRPSYRRIDEAQGLITQLKSAYAVANIPGNQELLELLKFPLSLSEFKSGNVNYYHLKWSIQDSYSLHREQLLLGWKHPFAGYSVPNALKYDDFVALLQEHIVSLQSQVADRLNGKV
jgi:hypothetical protein